MQNLQTLKQVRYKQKNSENKIQTRKSYFHRKYIISSTFFLVDYEYDIARNDFADISITYLIEV